MQKFVFDVYYEMQGRKYNESIKYNTKEKALKRAEELTQKLNRKMKIRELEYHDSMKVI